MPIRWVAGYQPRRMPAPWTGWDAGQARWRGVSLDIGQREVVGTRALQPVYVCSGRRVENS
jgi:hypothetical protein